MAKTRHLRRFEGIYTVRIKSNPFSLTKAARSPDFFYFPSLFSLPSPVVRLQAFHANRIPSPGAAAGRRRMFVNDKSNHGFIVGAFVDLLVNFAFVSGYGSDSDSHSSAIDEPCCCSSTFSVVLPHTHHAGAFILYCHAFSFVFELFSS
ncbi:Uncharacterized protein Adt_10024 [Abeliophyllum distichum]|uniref:Uncharacterized protein n=1 Tax=Abeliophyllum distichum TaxID=126358 RepID=A0ABD1UIU2_9LAMI